MARKPPLTPWFLVIVVSALGQATAEGPPSIPMQGLSDPGLVSIDRAVTRVMAEFAIPGATLTLSRHGVRMRERGSGLAGVDTGREVASDTLFALASMSKSLTAVAVPKLAEAGQLDLDTPVFSSIDHIRPLAGDTPDPRLGLITIRHRLIQAGGWDRRKRGDPNGVSRRVASRVNVALPIPPLRPTPYRMGQPLDFTPGTDTPCSRFGSLVLGLVLEKVTGKASEKSLRGLVLNPVGHTRVVLNQIRGSGYRPREAHRYRPNGQEDREGGQLPITMALGGWLATTAEMTLFWMRSRAQTVGISSARRAASRCLPCRPNRLGIGPTGAIQGSAGMSSARHRAVRSIRRMAACQACMR